MKDRRKESVKSLKIWGAKVLRDQEDRGSEGPGSLRKKD